MAKKSRFEEFNNFIRESYLSENEYPEHYPIFNTSNAAGRVYQKGASGKDGSEYMLHFDDNGHIVGAEYWEPDYEGESTELTDEELENLIDNNPNANWNALNLSLVPHK